MTQAPTSFLLGGPAGWPTGAAAGIGVGAATLVLATEPGGSFGLGSADESMGGLTVPRRVAVGPDGVVLLLHRARVRCLDHAAGQFIRLPRLGGKGSEARRFHEPDALAVARNDLLVADRGNRRVQVFDRRSLTLVRIWRRDDWDPADIIAGPRDTYVLDAANGQILHNHLGSDLLTPLVSMPGAASRWSRIAVDRSGRLYALDRADAALDAFDAAGRTLGRVRDPGDVRDRFDPPAVRSDAHGRLIVEGLPGRLFDSAGRPVARPPDENAGPATHVRTGLWTSAPLNSEIDRCQWHRIELHVDVLPAGTRVVVSTLSSADDAAPSATAEWATRRVLTGAVQVPGAGEPQDDEFLVQSRPGRYLRVRIELSGDGYATPVVGPVRTHFPRRSYLEHLPAIYSADEDSRWFLERFLSVVQTEWDAFSDGTRTVDRNFGAESAPAAFLRYLCSWLALPVEPSWSDDQVRRALLAARDIYPRRGTAAAVRAWLAVCLENLTGVPAPADGFPHLREGFAERRWLAFAGNGPSRLGTGAPVWGPGVVGRLQLDVFSREGEVRLVSTGDPERDVYSAFANRFSVFVPTAWVRSATDEAMVRRSLDAERPAHTAYELCLVEARVRVGIQSTVGVDTIVGDHPVARLGCVHDTGDAPSRPARHRLGHDMVLASPPSQGPGVRVNSRQRPETGNEEPS